MFTNEASFELPFEAVDLDGARYFVPKYAAHRPACRKVLAGEYYEPRTHAVVGRLLRDLRPGNMLHAGAFFGDMLPSFSRACGSRGTLYAFEPLLENYVLARLCVDHNRLENVVLFGAALGERVSACRISRMHEGRHRGGSSRVAASGEVGASVMTVDCLGLQQLSVLQLDLEGSELQALRGAEATLAAHRPVVMVEDQNKECGALLAAHAYVQAGAIPGLTVWSPPGLLPDLQAVLAA